jgi:hypothetical protein
MTADSNGTLVENARNYITINVEGDAELVGMDNGDSTDYDQYVSKNRKTHSRKLFSNRLIAIVRAKDENTPFVVTAASKDLPNVSVKFNGSEFEQISANTNVKPEKDFVPTRSIKIVTSEKPNFTKENKEIMKPLYYYYQKLKIAISKKSNNNSDMNSTTETIVRNDMNNNHNIHGSNVTNNQSVYPNTVSDSESMLTQDTFSNTNTNTITNSDLVSNTSESSRQSKISQNGNVYVNSMNNKGNNNMNYNIFHRKANSGGGPSNNPQIKVEEFNLNNRNNQKRSLSKEEINALEQEYFSIKKEQLNLTQMLRNYQNEFQKTNNRKVNWTKDIRPVEKEYNKYKANKERIKEIKELFGHIENNNNNK